jgi:hypothetical protein
MLTQHKTTGPPRNTAPTRGADFPKGGRVDVPSFSQVEITHCTPRVQAVTGPDLNPAPTGRPLRMPDFFRVSSLARMVCGTYPDPRQESRAWMVIFVTNPSEMLIFLLCTLSAAVGVVRDASEQEWKTASAVPTSPFDARVKAWPTAGVPPGRGYAWSAAGRVHLLIEGNPGLILSGGNASN